MASAIQERCRTIAQLGADSDSTQRTVHANYKEQVFLHRRILELERSERTSARSFSAEQRVTFRRFNRKLTQSRLLHARMSGDKDLEAICRHRLYGAAKNSELARLEEEEELEKMLGSYREERSCRQTSPKRSRTAPPPRSASRTPSVFLQTDSSPGSSRRPSCRRAKSAFPLRSARTPSWWDDRPMVSMLDLNAQLYRDSDQEGRVRRFCDRLREHQTSRGFDYYSVRAGESAGPSREKEKDEKELDEREKERRRETGDVHLRNLTFRSLQQPLFIYTHGVSRARPAHG